MISCYFGYGKKFNREIDSWVRSVVCTQSLIVMFQSRRFAAHQFYQMVGKSPLFTHSVIHTCEIMRFTWHQDPEVVWMCTVLSLDLTWDDRNEPDGYKFTIQRIQDTWRRETNIQILSKGQILCLLWWTMLFNLGLHQTIQLPWHSHFSIYCSMDFCSYFFHSGIFLPDGPHLCSHL